MAETDPFAAMGGGVKLPNGGWVPKNHPEAVSNLPTGFNLLPGSGAANIAAGGSSPSSSTAPASGGGGEALPPSPPPPSTTPATTPATSPSPGPGWVLTAEGGWVPPDHPLAAGATGTGTGSSTTGTTTGTTNTNATGAMGIPPIEPPDPLQGWEDPMTTEVRQQLLDLMARANDTPSLDDPTIAPQADAYAAAQERARRGMVGDMAERLSAKGLGSSGAADSALRGSYETMGQNVGEFNAGLLSEEQEARRADLKSALGLASNLGMTKEAHQLSRDLAGLDAEVRTNLANLDSQLRQAGLSMTERLAIMENELRKYGIDVQGGLGNLEIALRRELGMGGLNLGLLNALLGNQQFNDQLGWNMDEFVARMNAGGW